MLSRFFDYYLLKGSDLELFHADGKKCWVPTRAICCSIPRLTGTLLAHKVTSGTTWLVNRVGNLENKTLQQNEEWPKIGGGHLPLCSAIGKRSAAESKTSVIYISDIYLWFMYVDFFKLSAHSWALQFLMRFLFAELILGVSSFYGLTSEWKVHSSLQWI